MWRCGLLSGAVYAEMAAGESPLADSKIVQLRIRGTARGYPVKWSGEKEGRVLKTTRVTVGTLNEAIRSTRLQTLGLRFQICSL